MPSITHMDGNFFGNLNETSVIQTARVVTAPVTRGEWVELVDAAGTQADPLPTIQTAPVSCIRVYGVALETGAVGVAIPVVVAGYVGYALCTDPGVGTYPLGTAMEVSAAVAGEALASTFVAADGNPHVAPTSACGWAAAIIPNLAVTGPFIVRGLHS